MGFGCKNGADSADNKQLDAAAFGSSLFVRIMIFLISVVVVGILIIPVIIPMILIMLFNRIVLQRGTDVTSGLLKFGKILRTSKKRKDDDSEYEDVDEINPEDYDLMDVDVIKK